MAIKLSAYREGVLYTQVDVPPAGLRLGRGPHNEIILEDPEKRISRNHAEVRPEGEHFLLVDRDSANGTYVEGRRVTAVHIGTGMPFFIGPYRLLLEESTELDPRSAAAFDPEQATGAYRAEVGGVGDTFQGRVGPVTMAMQTGAVARGAWRIWVAAGAVVLALLMAWLFRR